jgi:hypothetical protein
MALLQIDWVKMSLSFVLAAYYIFYIIRLIKGCSQIGKNIDTSNKSLFNPLMFLTFAFAEQESIKGI